MHAHAQSQRVQCEVRESKGAMLLSFPQMLAPLWFGIKTVWSCRLLLGSILMAYRSLCGNLEAT